ncbi:aldo/keto reductase [Devosia indica]
MFQAIVDSGISYIDTAEIYGFGKSEEFLAEFMKETDTSPVISTKFPPFPWRLSSSSVVSSLEKSLERLDLDCAGLYMIHW